MKTRIEISQGLDSDVILDFHVEWTDEGFRDALKEMGFPVEDLRSFSLLLHEKEEARAILAWIRVQNQGFQSFNEIPITGEQHLDTFQ